MSNTVKRTLVASAALLAVGSAISPALAAPAAKHTALTVKVARTSVAPNAKDSLMGTLKSGTTALDGQTVKLEQRAVGSKTFKVVGTKKTNGKGQVGWHVKPGTKKGQKEQYELVFTATSSYKASHSSIITLTVK